MTEVVTPTTGDDAGTHADRQGFLRAQGGRVVDAAGRQVHLRGVGLGNWLLPEGYMWKFTSPELQSPRQIESFFLDLVGPERSTAFWRQFRARFITEADVARIAAEGMNHVRLPLNARSLIDDEGALMPEGFAPIDRLIDWCRRHGLWIVLDLHGAPGGQTGTNIDDSRSGRPELFLDPRYRDLTLRLWRVLAERYRDETVVAGYDLLNEPLPNEYQHRYADDLVRLYRDLTATIREVDANHLLIYEGSHWATNWSIFTEVWDENSMLSYHKYWSPPDRPSIDGFLEVAHALGLPIYMGEGGENNPGWLHTAFLLYDHHDIGWNFWPWKKLDTHSSPCSVDPPEGWQDILAYGNRHAPKPDPDDAQEALARLLEAVAIENCRYRAEIVSALMRTAPLRIPAAAFGFRGVGRSYLTTSGEPLSSFRNDDLVTLLDASGATPGELAFQYVDGKTNDQIAELEVELRRGDWLTYEFVARNAADIAIGVRVSRQAGDEALADSISVSLDGRALTTGGDGEFVAASAVRVSSGTHVIRLVSDADSVRLSSIEVSNVP